MNTSMTAARAGMKRGALEFRNSLKTPADIGYYIIGNAIFVIVLIFNRDVEIPGIDMPASRLIYPGVLAMILVFIVVYGLATLISTEREDGTLLRMKSIPHGMAGYVVGQSTRTSLELAFSVVVLTIASTILIPGVWEKGVIAMAGV